MRGTGEGSTTTTTTTTSSSSSRGGGSRNPHKRAKRNVAGTGIHERNMNHKPSHQPTTTTTITTTITATTTAVSPSQAPLFRKKDPATNSQRGPGEGENGNPSHQSVRRRFPGPAGALPALTENTDLDAPLQFAPHHSAAAKKKFADFKSPAWQHMVAQSGRNAWNGVRKQNIANILAEGRFGKIRFLAVMIRSVHTTARDASLVVCDPTGSLKGCLHPNVLKEIDPALFVNGAVLVLKQVSVFSPAPRRHYLNITTRNIIVIFSPDGSKTIFTQSVPSHQHLPKYPRSPVAQMPPPRQQPKATPPSSRAQVREAPATALALALATEPASLDGSDAHNAHQNDEAAVVELPKNAPGRTTHTESSTTTTKAIVAECEMGNVTSSSANPPKSLASSLALGEDELNSLLDLMDDDDE